VPDIRFVCLSDLHLGAANSLLTHIEGDGNRVAGPAPLLVAVLDGLRRLLRQAGSSTPPTLVLHGDLFELALTTTQVAAKSFGHLAVQAWGDPDEPLFAHEVLFVPGNHDHHLWEITREHQYEDYLRQAGDQIAPMRHVTSMDRSRLVAADHEPFVGALAARALAGCDGAVSPVFRVLYPNLGLVVPGGARGVVISHGHYLEPMYRAMSFLHDVVTPHRPPRLDTAELEADNWAWIDFFWSTMGRSGEGESKGEADDGDDDDDDAIPVLYELLQDRQALEALVGRVVNDFLPQTRSLIRALERWTLMRAGRRATALVAERERHHSAVLSPAATTGLANLIGGPIRGQLQEEFGVLPPRLDFVFGHTHKPFASRRAVDRYPGVVVAHNTGGWVVDAVSPEPVKGASIVLIGDDLEVVDLCIYRQEVDANRYRVEVTAVNDAPDEPTPLRDWLVAAVAADADGWGAVSQLAAAKVGEREHQLAARIERGTRAVRDQVQAGPRGW